MAYGQYDYSEDTSISLDAIPEETRSVLMRRTLRHIFGNETDAKVLKTLKVDKRDDADDDDWEAAAARIRGEYVEKLLNGTLSIRVGAPRGNTIENIAFELAMKQAEAALAPKGYWPKADRKNGVKAEEATVEFAGRVMTREDLADMVFEKYRDTLMEAAKVEHAKRAEKAKLAKANAVKAVGSVEESIENLI